MIIDFLFKKPNLYMFQEWKPFRFTVHVEEPIPADRIYFAFLVLLFV
jgi:hypothetical protein